MQALRPFAELKYSEGHLFFIGASQHALMNKIRAFDTFFDYDSIVGEVSDEQLERWSITFQALHHRTQQALFLGRRQDTVGESFVDSHTYLPVANLTCLRMKSRALRTNQRYQWCHQYGDKPYTMEELGEFVRSFKDVNKYLDEFVFWNNDTDSEDLVTMVPDVQVQHDVQWHSDPSFGAEVCSRTVED